MLTEHEFPSAHTVPFTTVDAVTDAFWFSPVSTYDVVATRAELFPCVCVVAVVPLARAPAPSCDAFTCEQFAAPAAETPVLYVPAGHCVGVAASAVAVAALPVVLFASVAFVAFTS